MPDKKPKNKANSNRPARPPFRFTRPMAALTIANTPAIVGVLWLGWEVYPLLLLYWLENGIIGLVTLLKIFTCKGKQRSSQMQGKGGTATFFILHFGGFWVVHGIFVRGMFSDGFRDMKDNVAVAIVAMPASLRGHHLLLPALAIAASHIYSYMTHFIGQGDRLTARLDDVWKSPYKRVVALHMTVILGAIVAVALGSMAYAMVFLVVIKTAIDLIAHDREHRRRGST